MFGMLNCDGCRGARGDDMYNTHHFIGFLVEQYHFPLFAYTHIIPLSSSLSHSLPETTQRDMT